MREICKSGSMRGSGRPASNAPATLYSTGLCGEEGRGLGCLRSRTGGAFAVFCHRKDLRERKQAGWNFRFRVCAGESGVHAGESPAGRMRRFTTESDVRNEAARPKPQAGHRLNQQAITKVNLIQ